MHSPCRCPECDDKSTIAAWLWRDVYGADPYDITPADDAALDRILDAIERHWSPGINRTAVVDAVRADMASWVPRGALLQ